MYKKLILITGIIAMGISVAHSQCAPDPSFTASGFHPDSLTGLADAQVGVAYDEAITIITPVDTTVDIGPFPVTLTMDSLFITSITGLPPGYTYSCAAPFCSFYGGTTSCISIIGTSVLADVGIYPIVIEYDLWLEGGAVPAMTILNDDYAIEVKNTAALIDLTADSFELMQNTPNPAHQSTTISFNTSDFGTYSFQVVNTVGELVYSEELSVNTVENTIELDLTDFKKGVYFYSLSNNAQRVTKTLMVN